MKKIAVLLNGGILNDARVTKVIRSLSKVHEVDLFFLTGKEVPENYFNKNVSLFPYDYKRKKGFDLKKTLFFFNEYMFFVDKVLSTKKRYDYIYANDLPCLKPAVKIAEKLECRVAYDSHEIYNETLNQFFPAKAVFYKKIIFKTVLFFMRMLGKMTEKKYLKKTTIFITVGHSLKEYFQKEYSLKEITVIMNWPNLQTSSKTIDLHEEIGIDKKEFLILYQGMLNYGRGLHLIIQSFQFTNPGIRLVILGDGYIKKELMELVKKLNLEAKVAFLPKVNHEVLLNYTKGADAGITLLEAFNLSKKLAAPNKLFEYMHAGLAVIASDSPETNRVFEKYSIGYVVKNNPKEIAAAINKMANSDKKNMQSNSLEAAKEYNWESQEKKLLSLFS